MTKSELKDLLLRYSVGECSEQEVIWVENWYIQQDLNESLPVSDEEFQNHLRSIYYHLPKPTRSKTRLTWMKVAAVVSFFTLSIGIYSYLAKNDKFTVAPTVSSVANDIAPGSNKATLTLSNGTILALDHVNEGVIHYDENLSISKTNDGEIVYSVSSDPSSSSNQSLVYNELNTPKGGKYQITLHDGSKVWLNASSSLKYPINFSSSERIVEFEGEAYFEIAKSRIPFYVITENQRIEVLGTQFNVKAYKGELSTKTTLVEGSVKLITKDKITTEKELILKPGEEALLTNDDGIQVSKVNVNQAIAWKNGFFHFEGADLKSVMHEFSIWYGVEVEFEGEIPDTKLWGKINRNVPASQALVILEYYDLKFNVVQNKGVSRIEISNKD